MVLKQLKLDLKMVLFIAVVLLTPICYLINPFLLVIAIYAGGFILASRVTGSGNKFITLLLYTVLFSGVSIGGFRPYDIVILFGMIIRLLKRKEKKIPVRIIPFILAVIFGLLMNYYSESLMESIRYITCIIVFIETMNDSFRLDELNNEIISITLCNIYYAIVVFLLINLGRFENYSSSIITSDIFVYTRELRFNGFFSDPNKYMTFCFVLLFISEGFLIKSKKRTFTVSLIIISSLIALSRTALIVIFVFAVLKIAMIAKKRSKPLFVVLISIAALLIILVAISPELINSFFNYLYVLSSKLMGRERQLELSNTIQEDNRTKIWGMALELIKKKPFIGYGWMSNEWLLPYPTHNTVFAILLDGGLIAFFTYILMFWPMYSSNRRDLVISCIIVPSLMLDLQNYRMWFLIYGLIVCPRVVAINNDVE